MVLCPGRFRVAAPGFAGRNVTKCTQKQQQLWCWKITWIALQITQEEKDVEKKLEKQRRDGGTPLKKQSNYVPGSLLDLWILYLWMKPLTAVDDEARSRFNPLASLTMLFQDSRIGSETHKKAKRINNEIYKTKQSVVHQLSSPLLW